MEKVFRYFFNGWFIGLALWACSIMYLIGYDLYISRAALMFIGHEAYVTRAAIAAVFIVLLIFLSVPFVSDSVSNSLLAKLVGYSQYKRAPAMSVLQKFSLVSLGVGIAFGLTTTPLLATLFS